jgi:HlyD family secretion protein
MSGRKVAVLSLIVLAGAGGAWWWFNRPSPPLQWQGYAEADFVKVGPTQ